MLVEYVKPTVEDALFIADNMREADRIEVAASHSMSPREAIRYSIKISDFCTIGKIKGEPCGVFGLVKKSMLTDTGSPWFLGTDLIFKEKRKFIEQSKVVIDEMFDICSFLENYVHSRNVNSIRWLKSVGFKFDRAQPYGLHGELFHRFYKVRNNV